MIDLIGKKFKRNKYGLSIWTDTIKEVYIMRCYTTSKHYAYKPILMVKGSNWSYEFDEIVILDK